MITGLLTGYFGGLLYGIHESAVQLLDQPSKEYLTPFRQVKELIYFILVPALIYAVAFAVIFALAGLCVYLINTLLKRTLERDQTIAFYVGLFFAFAAFIFLLHGFNTRITLGILFYPPRLFFTLRNLLGSILAGVAVRYLVILILRRYTWMSVVKYGFAALVSSFFTFIALLFVNRNYMRLDINSRNGLVLFGLLAADFILILLIAKLMSAFFSSEHRARKISIWCTALSPLLILLALWLSSLGIKKEAEAANIPHKVSDCPYNVILISIDTLRSDYLSSYGGEYETPDMDRIAEEGALFENCHVQSSWTLTSLATMHTGMYPTVNGLDDPKKKISEVRKTLAEYLHEKGFLTQSFVTNGYTRQNFGFAQGFDRYNHMTQGVKKNLFLQFLFGRTLRAINPDVFKEENLGSAENITKHAMDFLEAAKDSRFFLWLHYIDPHDPYAPPETEWIPPSVYNGWMNPYDSGLILPMRTGYRISSDDMQHLRNLYIGEVRYIDNKIGQLMEKIEALGLADNTFVILTSDHGEEFWEHEGILHGGTLYQEVMNVPLLMRLPGVIPEGSRLRPLVRVIDIMPTILTLQGISFEEHIQGRDLMPVILGEEKEDRESFSESLLYFGEKKAVFDGRYKLIHTWNSDRKELYDLQTDPDEQNNLFYTEPEIAAGLELKLMEWVSASRKLGQEIAGTDVHAVIDSDLRQELQALGYVN
jgi:arylsulfatase A-like enzyme